MKQIPVILSAGEIPKFYFGGYSINMIQNYYSKPGVWKYIWKLLLIYIWDTHIDWTIFCVKSLLHLIQSVNKGIELVNLLRNLANAKRITML